MSVAVEASASFRAGPPQALFASRLRRTPIAQYDVFPDGERFLMNAIAGEDTAPAVQIIENWTAG